MRNILVTLCVLTIAGSVVAQTMTPTATASATHTHTPTPTATASATHTHTPTPTATASATFTPDVTAEVTPDVTAEMAFVMLIGQARYQNHMPGHSGIEIQVIGADGSQQRATTDVGGMYRIAVPQRTPFDLIADGPLHRRVQLTIVPGQALPTITLSGGDLNGDGCIGSADIQRLIQDFNSTRPTSDINGDGRVDTADLAIVSGNYEGACVPDQPPAPTAARTAVFAPVPETTVEAREPLPIDTTTSTPIATVTAERTASPTTDAQPEGTRSTGP